MTAYIREFPLPPIGRVITSPEQVERHRMYGLLRTGAAGHHWYEPVLAHSVSGRTMRYVEPRLHRHNPRTIVRPDGSVYFRELRPHERPYLVEWNDSLARHSPLVKASSDATERWYVLSGGVPVKPGYILTEEAIDLILDMGPECVPFLLERVAQVPDWCEPYAGPCCT